MTTLQFWSTQSIRDCLKLSRKSPRKYKNMDILWGTHNWWRPNIKVQGSWYQMQKEKKFLKQIHEGHLGLNKCQMHAKETVYWPGLNDQLEQLILNCQLCLKFSRLKKKDTTYSSRSWSTPGTMEQSSYWHIPLQVTTISAHSQLYQ